MTGGVDLSRLLGFNGRRPDYGPGRLSGSNPWRKARRESRNRARHSSRPFQTTGASLSNQKRVDFRDEMFDGKLGAKGLEDWVACELAHADDASDQDIAWNRCPRARRQRELKPSGWHPCSARFVSLDCRSLGQSLRRT